MPGQPTYAFSLDWRREKITGLEEMKEINLAEFERRRRLQSGLLQIKIACVVNGETLGSSPSLPLSYETWATSSSVTHLIDSDMVDAISRAICPYTFDLAVHTMPRSVALEVWVGTRIRWRRKWERVGRVEVGIPASGAGKVQARPARLLTLGIKGQEPRVMNSTDLLYVS